MSSKDPAKRQPKSKHVGSHETKPQQSPLTTANVKFFQHPLSAFSRHRIHQLSDIREASGSSKDGTVRRNAAGFVDGPGELGMAENAREQTARAQDVSSEDVSPLEDNGPSRGLGSRAPSGISLPFRDVPERRSSASVLGYNSTSRPPSELEFPSWRLPSLSHAGMLIPSRGRSNSPVRKAQQRDAVSSERMRRSSSKTFVRPTPPLEFLDTGASRHGRIDLSVQLPAPLFVGGATIEGHINITVDGGPLQKAKTKPILMSALTVDVIGVEEVNDGRRWIFLSLATEVFNESYPPPMTLVNSQLPVSKSEIFWTLKPAFASIPFCVNLPLNVGPPPYTSKQASIRYFVCPSVAIKSGEKQSIIRQMCNIQMLTVYDPEKALASLPSPLLASDSISVHSGTEVQRVELTAGLHRQTWVNGGKIFVDFHIANRTSKTIKKIDVRLVKTTLWYSHLAAGTGGHPANHLRLPKRTDKEVVSTSTVKKSKDWTGVLPYSPDTRTCDISVPRELVTVSTGRFFEVRYFLNITVAVSRFKAVTVELPVTIIHMNSLDILPNSLAQVAVSIEAKRARTVPVREEHPHHLPFNQGQAFTAPRRQSLDRTADGRGSLNPEELSALGRDLDVSPRRYHPNIGHRHKITTSTTALDDSVLPGRPSGVGSSHHHHTRHPSCYHCHLGQEQSISRKASNASSAGLKLPRLQLSTSGLGFSDSEFEIPPDSPPRKVMLSESERQMILQQREQKLQRQQSRKSRRKPGVSLSTTDRESGAGSQNVHWGWKNVAVELEAGVPGENCHDGRRIGLERVHSAKTGRAEKRRSGHIRVRSKTNPERLGTRAYTHRRPDGGSDRSNWLPMSARSSYDMGRRMSYDQSGRNTKIPLPRSEWS